MNDDDQVLILFQITNFGWQPVLMRWDTWQEIYDFYEEAEECELNDNEGQVITVDLCECVKNAIVVKETLAAETWIEAADSVDFFSHICLDPIKDAWALNIELAVEVSDNLARRNAEIHDCKIISLGTTLLTATLKGHLLTFTYSVSLGETVRNVRIGSETHDLDEKEPKKHLNRLLDKLQPIVKSSAEVNLRPVYADEEAKISVEEFGDFIAGE